MIAPNQRAALAALSAARPTVARLDISRDPEEVAADMLEVWSSTETALRSLMGSTVLGGQPLIRELRHREIISIDLAHALLEFLAVRERIQDTSYRPTNADISATREAFQMLQDGLMLPGGPAGAGAPGAATAADTVASAGAAGAGSGAPPGTAAAPAAAATSDPYASASATSRLRQSRFLALGAAAVAILAIAGAVVWLLVGRGGEPSGLQAGRQAYAAGLRDSARAVFAKVALENQDLFTPFLYLGRIAREQGDFAAAARHLTRAARLAPDSAIVHRELGSFFLARANYYALRSRPDLALGDYNAARRSFVRAVQLDPRDATAKGYLGCALVRAGRPDEGARWLSQAGEGPWRQCAPAVQGLPPRPPQ